MRKNALLLFLFLLPGCAYVTPLIEDFNVISPSQEIQIGNQTQAEVAQQMKVSTSGADVQRIQAIGYSLVSALPHKDFPYRFYVVDDPTPNAFTIPGGTIYVHSGLLKFTSDDMELAGVLAHEIGHAYDRHPAKAISREYGVDFLTKLLFKENNSELRKVSLQFATQAALLRYGREEEFKADEIGFALLRRSGRPTSGLIRFFQKLQAAGQGGASIPFLSTHPPTPERIARLQQLEQGTRTFSL